MISDNDSLADNLGLTLIGRRKGWGEAVNANFEKISKLHAIDNSGNIWTVNNAIYDSAEDVWTQPDTSKASTAMRLNTDGTIELLFCASSAGNISWHEYSVTPVGTISAFAGETAPSGWLICDGSAVSRTEYAELFAVIGSKYGIGDGETTYNLPDLRAKFLLGASEDYPLSSIGGEASHKLTQDEIPTSVASFPVYGQQSWASVRQVNGAADNLTHNNMPPYLAINYIIKF